LSESLNCSSDPLTLTSQSKEKEIDAP